MDIRVFKFGGASLKDAKGIRNMAEIVKQHKDTKLCIIASAMGKTTNALENLLENYWQKRDYQDNLQVIEAYHLQIVEELFDKSNFIFDKIEQIFKQLEYQFKLMRNWKSFDKTYDQVVSFGELLSTNIISAFLNNNKLKCVVLDAKEVIKTNDSWREGEIIWQVSQKLVQDKVKTLFKDYDFILSQGFIAGNDKGDTTTLGREGSDFSGAIFAHSLNAKSLTIWKDVDGVLNADPRKFPQASLFANLSYKEAALMSKYGASVIHPKTIAPLAKKEIPLYVKPFLKPEQKGTCIHLKPSEKNTSILISKEKQILLDFEAKSFSFFLEKDLAFITNQAVEYNIKINLLHKSATHCNICANDYPHQVANFLKKLKDKYIINIQREVTLLTVLNGNKKTIDALIENKKVMLKEEKNGLFQAVIRN